MNYGYVYDDAWNLTARTNSGSVQAFGVNALNQLTNGPASSYYYDGNGNLRIEDGSFTAVTDVASAASLCSMFVPVLLTPSADGTFALQWANQDSGAATGPTLKKGSWMRVADL